MPPSHNSRPTLAPTSGTHCSQRGRAGESWRWARCDVALAMEAPAVRLLAEPPLKLGRTAPPALPPLSAEDPLGPDPLRPLCAGVPLTRRILRPAPGVPPRHGALTERSTWTPKTAPGGAGHATHRQQAGCGGRSVAGVLPQLRPDGRRHRLTSRGNDCALDVFVPTAATFTKQIRLREDVVRLLEQSWTDEQVWDV